MNAISQPHLPFPVLPTLHDLIQRAVDDHAVMTDFTHSENLNEPMAQLIAARGIQAAIEDWCWDNAKDAAAIPDALRDVAFHRLIGLGWAARDARRMECVGDEERAWGPIAVRAAYMADRRV